jgi:16S rRNA (cytosine1402-N4)-methyltransferase
LDEKAFHEPVLREEVLHYLITKRTSVYVDCTTGGGGHAEAICGQLSGDGQLICFDADEDAIARARGRLGHFGSRVAFVHSNFKNLMPELRRLHINHVQGLLLDLGVSSFQLDNEERGFSFRADERIDMRMDRRQPLAGWDIVNRYEEKRLADVLWKYGEERNARRIARRIVQERDIDTTGALSRVVERVVGKQYLTKSLARIFQAIRIEVNDELGSLKGVLNDVPDVLTVGGRIVALSYHSLEDRIVKEFFKKESARTIPSGNKLVADVVRVPRLRILTKKPVKATAAELDRNPRARSAKMRVAEKCHG